MKKKGMKKYAKKDDEAEAGMPPEVKEKMEEMKKKEKEAKADEAEAEEVTQEVFEEVETSEATLVVSEETDELDSARASVADWFSNHVLNK